MLVVLIALLAIDLILGVGYYGPQGFGLVVATAMCSGLLGAYIEQKINESRTPTSRR